ncbi:hypothetical protein MMC13_006099 [Lambiella insularis]|nr:hypothetical protein [Lambiella insularis]
MSTDEDIWRLASIAYGFFGTAMRRALATHQFGPQSYQKFSFLTQYTLRTDIVRTIRLGTLPTMAKALGELRLEPTSDLTISQLTNKVFDREHTTWTFDSPEVAFIAILLILTQIIIYAMMWEPLGHSSKCCDSAMLFSLTISDEARVTERRIEHALLSWQACYLDSVGPQLGLLYHFCYMLFSTPGLLALARKAAVPTSLEPSTMTLRQRSQNSLNLAAHHAWCLLEKLTQLKAEDRSSISLLLPVVTFLAALCVWKNIKAQDGSKTRGSLKVLQLFTMELEKMPWPCSQEMMEYLKTVT